MGRSVTIFSATCRKESRWLSVNRLKALAIQFEEGQFEIGSKEGIPVETEISHRFVRTEQTFGSR
jgi:hypothetical protein